VHAVRTVSTVRTVRAAMERLLAHGGSSAASRYHGGLHHLEEGAGRPVVLLHGGSGGGANWFRMLAALSAKYRVYAPDLPGFGLSDHGSPAAPLGRTAAVVLHEWLLRTGLQDVLLVGTSFGGLAALRLAQQATDRVAGLLLLDSAGLGRGLHPLVRLAAVPGLTAPGVRPSRRGTAALFRGLLTHDRSELTADVQAALIDYLHASANVAGTAYLASTLRCFAGPLGQREVVSGGELEALRLPLSFVWGELDTLLPVRHAHRAAARCRDARVVVVPHVGHSPNWERPGPVLAAIDELAARASL
jgi:pimeloyl-ACP methyl ester carboxylesterase